MPSSVKDPWEDEVDIADWSQPDFEARDTSFSVYDKNGDLNALVEALRHHYGLPNQNELFDRAIRMFLAYLLDTDDLPNLRAKHNVTVLIPPEGWIKNFDREPVEPIRGDFDGGPATFKTTETVKKIAKDLLEHPAVEINDQSEFASTAVQWLSKADTNIDTSNETQTNTEGPSAIRYVMASEARRKMVEWFCDLALDENETTDKTYTKSGIADEIGISRNAVIEHIDVLCEFGIVEGVGEKRLQYRPNYTTEFCFMIDQLNQQMSRYVEEDDK